MGNKKDPGKFTIRFNIADPQQQAAVELLNRQGRYKAQFITSAVLLYAYAASNKQTTPLLNSSAIQHTIQEIALGGEAIGAEGAAAKPSINKSDGLEDLDVDAIRKTMQAFHTA